MSDPVFTVRVNFLLDENQENIISQTYQVPYNNETYQQEQPSYQETYQQEETVQQPSYQESGVADFMESSLKMLEARLSSQPAITEDVIVKEEEEEISADNLDFGNLSCYPVQAPMYFKPTDMEIKDMVDIICTYFGEDWESFAKLCDVDCEVLVDLSGYSTMWNASRHGKEMMKLVLQEVFVYGNMTLEDFANKKMNDCPVLRDVLLDTLEAKVPTDLLENFSFGSSGKPWGNSPDASSSSGAPKSTPQHTNSNSYYADGTPYSPYHSNQGGYGGHLSYESLQRFNSFKNETPERFSQRAYDQSYQPNYQNFGGRSGSLSSTGNSTRDWTQNFLNNFSKN